MDAENSIESIAGISGAGDRAAKSTLLRLPVSLRPVSLRSDMRLNNGRYARFAAFFGGAEQASATGGNPLAQAPMKSSDQPAGSALATATLPSITRPASLRTATKE